MSFLRWFWFLVCLLGATFSFANITEGDIEQPVWLSTIMFGSLLIGAIGALLKNKLLVWFPLVGLLARLALTLWVATNISYALGAAIGTLVPAAIMCFLSLGFAGKIKF